MCRDSETGALRAYGAGLLSSFGELEVKYLDGYIPVYVIAYLYSLLSPFCITLQYACSPSRPAGGSDEIPDYRVWDPRRAAAQDYPITSYQPVYFVAESMRDAKARMRDYCDSLERGFLVSYDEATQTVTPDRGIIKGSYLVTLQK